MMLWAGERNNKKRMRRMRSDLQNEMRQVSKESQWLCKGLTGLLLCKQVNGMQLMLLMIQLMMMMML